MKIITECQGICIEEPRGEYGLEGYRLGRPYRAQKVVTHNDKYFRVYPYDSYSSDITDVSYYETCSYAAFHICFKEIKQ